MCSRRTAVEVGCSRWTLSHSGTGSFAAVAGTQDKYIDELEKAIQEKTVSQDATAPHTAKAEAVSSGCVRGASSDVRAMAA